MSVHKTLLATRRLLIADDEAFSRSFVVRMVRGMGCQDILEAADGAQALDELAGAGESLSAAILDFNMPETNGLQVLKRVRTGKAGVPRNSNILMLTGSSDFSLVGAAMALDVDAFLVKPLSEAVLADRLTGLFRETSEVKPIADYEEIDVEGVSARLLASKPTKPKGAAPKVIPRRPAEVANPGTARVAVDAVAPGSILAENVRTPDGELLLGAATVLSERLLRRLLEIQSAIKLDTVVIFINEGAR
jgi:CheY-like chemotaxis protein